MPWFSKKDKQIEAVPPEERTVKTENVFVKCDGCEAHLYNRELEEGLQVCSHCGYHFRIGVPKIIYHKSFDQRLIRKLVSHLCSTLWAAERRASDVICFGGQRRIHLKLAR